jgi:hypothetical protein
MESALSIGDKVKVGDKVGEVIRLDHKGSSTIIKVAFEEEPAKDFVCPPTKLEKILSPIEQIQNNKLVGCIGMGRKETSMPIIFSLQIQGRDKFLRD